MRRLEGKTALITGAARGIGAQIARRFHEHGAKVVINDLRPDDTEALAKELDGLAIVANVADSEAVAEMFAQALEYTGGTLDILVNNAGINGLEDENGNPPADASIDSPGFQPDQLTRVTDAEWQRMIGVHLGGVFHCSRAALQPMLTQGSGSIINMSSVMGTFGRPGATAYSAAKGGILGFSRALAHEVGPAGIRVNCIAPGWIETVMTAPMAPIKEHFLAGIPLGHLGNTDDIALAALYLASSESGYVTGQVLSPNGGWYMSQ